MRDSAGARTGYTTTRPNRYGWGETMSRVIEVLQTVLPVALMLVIGMVCRSRKLISREGVNALKR